MEVEFIEPASIELDDAIEYYNLHSTDLGGVFFEEVLEAIELISNFPKVWSKNTEHTRKATLKKFPYNLIYSIYREKIYILAVAHHHRAPEYWIDRIF
ncbi:type II toxin-antitoxin system RelE/ParE family toxin [bacterium]|nr:type II toxin-antitoxin system RelE/ParE family toxin [bacterium]